MSAQPSSRVGILDRGLDMLRRGEAVSLDSVARTAGLTKPGLMYHFPTKQALMTALVDHQLDGCEQALDHELAEVAGDGSPTVEQRLRAYVRWAFTAEHDRADLVMLSDPRLRDHLTARWTSRFASWVEVPDDLAPERRARLLAARLLADGHWFTEASNTIALTPSERRQVLSVVAEHLLGPAQPAPEGVAASARG